MAVKAYNEIESAKYLAENGICTVKSVVLTQGTAEELEKAAAELGFPAVMKILSDDILHKTDAGCVVLGINSVQEMQSAYRRILENARKYKPDARIQGVVAEQMIPAGLEALVGVSTDPQFGRVLMVGLGGIMVELLKAVSLRVIPVTRYDAEEMLDETPLAEACRGLRGTVYNRVEIIDILMKVSAMAENDPALREIDINPLMLYGDGRPATAVDAVVIRETDDQR